MQALGRRLHRAPDGAPVRRERHHPKLTTLHRRGFVEILRCDAKQIANLKGLGHESICPDVIEPGGATTKNAMSVKGRHNIGGLPETPWLKLLKLSQPLQG